MVYDRRTNFFRAGRAPRVCLNDASEDEETRNNDKTNNINRFTDKYVISLNNNGIVACTPHESDAPIGQSA